MELMSSWEQRGIEKGLEQGLEQGLQQGLHQGKEQLLEVILEHRFSTLPSDITARLDKLSSAQLDDLAKALLGFNSLADLESWLAQH